MKPPQTRDRAVEEQPQSFDPRAERLVGQEHLLLDYVRKLERHRRGRQVAILHLSALQPPNRREHHVRIAMNAFENLVKQLKGQLFMLSNSDLVFIFKDAALDETEAAIVKVKFLFSDDPLLVDDSSNKVAFVDWFDLERDYEALLVLSQRAAHEEDQRRTQEFTKGFIAQQVARQAPVGQPLTPQMLMRIEEALIRADLSNMLRRQAICAIVGKAAPQPIFHELFVSIADLRETLLPDVNLASSPWLFQHLTETLDRRVLALLIKHDDRTVAGDVSINLNVQTLIAPEFLVFDDNLQAGMRGTIVLEVQKVDAFADLGSFLFARDFAHERGYRICIDGANLESLPFIDRQRRGVDLVKVNWSPAMKTGLLPNGVRLEQYVHRCGPGRLILARVDDQDAIDFGRQVGITMFQGRHVEALIASDAKRVKGISALRR
jgi:hypothetical protein